MLEWIRARFANRSKRSAAIQTQVERSVAAEKELVCIPSPPRMGKVYLRGDDSCPFARRIDGNPPVVQDTRYQPVQTRRKKQVRS